MSHTCGTRAGFLPGILLLLLSGRRGSDFALLPLHTSPNMPALSWGGGGRALSACYPLPTTLTSLLLNTEEGSMPTLLFLVYVCPSVSQNPHCPFLPCSFGVVVCPLPAGNRRRCLQVFCVYVEAVHSCDFHCVCLPFCILAFSYLHPCRGSGLLPCVCAFPSFPTYFPCHCP